MLYGAFVGVEDLLWIKTAALQVEDLFVSPVRDQSCCLRVFAKKFLAHISAILGFERLITLITFQPVPRKADSSSLMIFPLPRTGPSRRWRLQLITKIRLSSFSRDASVSCAPSTSGSSVSPSPTNAHTLRGVGLISPRFSR